MIKIFECISHFFPWIAEVLKDIDGFPSSKRVLAFISTLFMMTLGVANTFFSLHVEQFIFESFRDIVIAGIGFAGAEKFTSRPNTPDDSSSQ
jgi:hypothetical protein